jgi:hypothetical protein
MDARVMKVLKEIAVNYMESETTTVATSSVLGQVMGAAIVDTYGELECLRFRSEVAAHAEVVLARLEAERIAEMEDA